MPELPEVETVRRGLEPVLVGSRIQRIEMRRPDLRFPLPERFAERLEGQRVMSLTRRAKYLIMALEGGDDVVMHLGMTGRFSVVSRAARETPGAYVYATAADPKHDHVVLELSNATRIVYNDPRRFGFMMMMPQATRDTHALFKAIGVEPLGNHWTPDHIAARAKGRKTNLKAFLMDQRNVAGLGNIYVSEALHRAGLSPNRSAASLADRKGLPTDRARRLVPAVRDVLEQAIAAGGSTLRDYRQSDGTSGQFQDAFAVYDRAGESCARSGCAGTVRRIVHGGRATYFCGSCQR